MPSGDGALCCRADDACFRKIKMAGPSPLEKTFAVLANNQSADADALLLKAVVSSVDGIARRGAKCLGQKASPQRITELIKLVDHLGGGALEELAKADERLNPHLKPALQNPQPQQRAAALEFVRRASLISQLSLLLQLVDDHSNSLQTQTSDVVRELVTKLAYRLAGNEQEGLQHLSDEAVRSAQMGLLNELDRRSEKFDDIRDQELYVESILLLGKSDCTAVKNVLDKRGSAGRHMVKTVLQKAKHPHLMDLVCETLTHREPHQKLLQVFVSREDVLFVTRVLEWLPATITGTIAKNLEQIDELPWLSLTHATWLEIPLPLHGKLVQLINALNLPKEQKHELKKWILQNSGPEGRAAAGDLFNDLGDEEAQEVLYDALADENPEVEAWATHQLRSQAIPDKWDQLIKRLDSTSDIVRDAAREELSDFNLDKMFGLLAKLPRDKAQKCGEIVRKIDPNTANTLRSEMKKPAKTFKVRATRAAAALGMVDELLNSIGALTEDPDTGVRRIAIEVLQESASPDARKYIERRLQDPNRFVRETAKRALNMA